MLQFFVYVWMREWILDMDVNYFHFFLCTACSEFILDVEVSIFSVWLTHMLAHLPNIH